jgi:hypothetical protein
MAENFILTIVAFNREWECSVVIEGILSVAACRQSAELHVAAIDKEHVSQQRQRKKTKVMMLGDVPLLFSNRACQAT